VITCIATACIGTPATVLIALSARGPASAAAATAVATISVAAFNAARSLSSPK